MEKFIIETQKIDRKNILDTLNKYGLVIIPRILNQTEIENMNNGMWDFLEHITQKFEIPIKRNKKETWNSFYQLYPVKSMIIQHWSMGHSQHIWDIRQNPKIVDIFAKIWDCHQEDLLTSFDASSFHFPPEETGLGFDKDKKDRYWYHTDQSFKRNDFECVQSWITGFDVNEGDATLAFLENSHNFHKDFAIKFNAKKKDDWYQLNDEHLKFYIDHCGCDIKKVECPAGSMVLWDSRLIHCGIEPSPERKKPNFRNVSYICMMPRALSDSENIKKKIQAFEELKTTTHWATKAKLFHQLPFIKEKEMPNITPISPPILTELGKKLAGYTFNKSVIKTSVMN